MTSEHRGTPGDSLHHEDGTHRSTPPTANGHQLELHERALVRHLADGHTHEPDPDFPRVFRIERAGAVDLQFDGVLLAEQTNHDDDGMERWTEVRIYRTDRGKYVSEWVGRSIVEGEKDRRQVHVVPDAADLPRVMRRRRRSAETGQRVAYLPDISYDALRQAGERDPAIAEALVETI